MHFLIFAQIILIDILTGSFLLASKCSVLLKDTALLMHFSFSSKTVFFIKSAMSCLIANFLLIFSLTVSLVLYLLKSLVVIYTEWSGIWSSKSLIFTLSSVF